MSSGVSDQMKVHGNTAKNVEERNIPWSQQVDEATSYENLASPATDDNSAANQSSMQFQYPPFNVKENQNVTWNNYNKPRKSSSNNYESNNKKYGKPAFYNNAKRDDFQPNAWGTQNSRRTSSDNPPGNYNRSNRPDDGYNTSGKLDNRPGGGANTTTDEKKTSAPPAAAAAKKTTWASIASQPAKLTSRTTLTTSSHKKKAGMPPPPMVPGKHNLDVNTWDLPNNNPPPVPSPPPPVDLAYVEANPDFGGDFLSIEQQHHELGARPEKGHKGGVGGGGGAAGGLEFPSRQGGDDNNKSNNYNNTNYGRVRSSPNGHPRKTWTTQGGPGPGQGQGPLPHHQHPFPSNQRQIAGAGVGGPGGSSMTAGPMRRGGGEGGMSSGGSGGGGGGRYGGDRRGNYGGPRGGDHDGGAGASYDYRSSGGDEISSRHAGSGGGAHSSSSVDELTVAEKPQAVLEELRDKNNYNPAELDLEIARTARFFVIKSYLEDDIHRSIKYEIWCSTDHGNKRLDDAFKERQKENGNVLLFFSVNCSGHFCGMAQMMTAVDYNSTSSVWSQDKWKGKFKVKWIYVKDVPNTKFRHIRIENNDNKPVTNSRDTQEVPNAQGIEVLQILHAYKHSTSIFDDFYHYEKKQEEEVSYKKPLPHGGGPGGGGGGSMMFSQQSTQPPSSRSHYQRMNDDRERGGDRGGDGRGPQKYFGGGGSGSGGGSGFRDRNNARGGGGGGGGGGYHNNYNEHRRFESHRTPAGAPNNSERSERDIDTDRERERENSGGEYSGSRTQHAQKFGSDYNRRGGDERERGGAAPAQSKQQQQQQHNNRSEQREREFSEEHSKSGGGSGDSTTSARYRTGPREMQKDNEYPITDRGNRGTDY